MPGEQMELINVFQYWHGERTPAILRLEKTVETLYSEERGYKYHRLTDEDMPPEIRVLLDTCRVPNVTDLFRYWLLYNYGGVWFDSDMAVRRMIDFYTILIPEEVVATANVRTRKYFASPCILAGNKGCFLFKKLINFAMPTLQKNGYKIGYDEVGPGLLTRIMNNHKKRWFILPDHNYKHQMVGFNRMEYRDDSDMQRYVKEIYGNYWHYAHFNGGNVRWWNNQGMPSGCVMGDTVERCEKELGYTYEREVR